MNTDVQGETAAIETGSAELQAAATPRRKSLLDLTLERIARPLERLEIREDEEALLLFTPAFEEVESHYVDDPEVRAYVRCNGAGCPLCAIGRKSYKRFLLPAYTYGPQAVVALPIGDSRRPYALLPQIQEVLLRQADSDPLLVLIRRENQGRYSVTTRPLPKGVDGGEAAIAAFVRAFEAGELSLSAVYQSLTNAELGRLPGIEAQILLRGLTAHEDAPRFGCSKAMPAFTLLLSGSEPDSLPDAK